MGCRKGSLEPVQAWRWLCGSDEVFGDALEVMIHDPVHSDAELRFVSIGLSEVGRLLVVAYTDRDQRVRIKQRAGGYSQERRQYESKRQS
jgi:uncharacterized DUF497 family protein